jgi:hypothetical protein
LNIWNSLEVVSLLSVFKTSEEVSEIWWEMFRKITFFEIGTFFQAGCRGTIL